jgi:hypothetical protein
MRHKTNLLLLAGPAQAAVIRIGAKRAGTQDRVNAILGSNPDF